MRATGIFILRTRKKNFEKQSEERLSKDKQATDDRDRH